MAENITKDFFRLDRRRARPRLGRCRTELSAIAFKLAPKRGKIALSAARFPGWPLQAAPSSGTGPSPESALTINPRPRLSQNPESVAASNRLLDAWRGSHHGDDHPRTEGLSFTECPQKFVLFFQELNEWEGHCQHKGFCVNARVDLIAPA